MSKEQKITLLLIILVGGAAAGFYVSNSKKTAIETPVATQTNTPVATVPTVPETTPTVPATTSEKSYSQDVTYNTPENGTETIHVTLALTNGVIDDVKFSYDTPNKRESAFNLGNFEKALSAQGLVGKKVTDVSLSKVGGASLTTGAFNKAVSQIAAKA